MMDYIRGEAEKSNVPSGKIHKLELAAEEALVNVISYGHPSTENALEIACVNDGPHFVVQIKDWGPEFNPVEADIDIQRGASVEERKIGGLGIHLFRKLVDEVAYLREDMVNTLSFTLRLEVQ